MTLGPSSSGAKPDCPFQQGAASGTRNKVPVKINVEYLIDTGSDIALVQARVGSRFDVVTVPGFTASPTTGGGGIQVVTGITVHFIVEDHRGRPHQVQSSKYVGVKSANTGSDLIGMAQIVDVGAELRWNPGAKSGTLQV